MFFSKITTFLVLLLISFALALPAPQAAENSADTCSPTASIAEPAANATSGGTPCSPDVAALASGISANIAVQSSEAAGAASLAKLLAACPLDTAAFAKEQKVLLGFVEQGITIRQANQKITPKGNAATAGLATVAMAQMEELDLTKSLGNGTLNVASASKTVETLKKDFAGGLVQNMKNLAAAKGNCTV